MGGVHARLIRLGFTVGKETEMKSPLSFEKRSGLCICLESSLSVNHLTGPSQRSFKWHLSGRIRTDVCQNRVV